MTYKYKTHVVDFEGKITSNVDVDFYIDDVCYFFVSSYPMVLPVCYDKVSIWNLVLSFLMRSGQLQLA